MWAVDGGVVEECYFVGEEEFGDGEVVGFGCGEEFGCAAEWVRDCAGGGGLGVLLGFELGGGEDEAAAYGVEDVLVRRVPAASKAEKRMPLGCVVTAGSGYIWSRWKRRFSASMKGMGWWARRLRVLSGADGGEFGFDVGGVDGVGGFA